MSKLYKKKFFKSCFELGKYISFLFPKEIKTLAALKMLKAG